MFLHRKAELPQKSARHVIRWPACLCRTASGATEAHASHLFGIDAHYLDGSLVILLRSTEAQLSVQLVVHCGVGYTPVLP